MPPQKSNPLTTSIPHRTMEFGQAACRPAHKAGLGSRRRVIGGVVNCQVLFLPDPALRVNALDEEIDAAKPLGPGSEHRVIEVMSRVRKWHPVLSDDGHPNHGLRTRCTNDAATVSVENSSTLRAPSSARTPRVSGFRSNSTTRSAMPFKSPLEMT